MQRLVVLGAGELGTRVARRACASGQRVLAVTATPARHAELRALSGELEAVTAAAEGWGVSPEDDLLLAVPGALQQLAALSALADRGCEAPRRLVQISSTGIHGSKITGIVDESSPVGASERCSQLAQAEAACRDLAGARSCVSLRAGGLYRPGRGPFAHYARQGSVPDRDPDRRLALLHYDDLATASLAALEHPDPQPVYLCVTSSPARRDFYRAACERLELPWTEPGDPLPSPEPTFDCSAMGRDLLDRPEHTDWRDALS